ncbi:MAG: hypothetical protein ACYC5A_03555 [Thermoleophilia bacterium]
MVKVINCPYCGQEKNKEGSIFCECHICGYKSAVVKGADGGYLFVVDRRMPYLERRCQSLAERMPDMNVVIDRRIAQDELLGPNRRQSFSLEAGEGIDLFQAD